MPFHFVLALHGRSGGRNGRGLWACGFAAAAAAMALASASAWAQEVQPTPWERIGVYEGRTLYVDHSTSRKSGSRIQIFSLTDLREPNATARGRTYWSKKALLEFDCSARTFRVLQDTWYPRRMGQGEPVFLTDGSGVAALPVQSDSPSEMFWKAACGRR